MIATVPPPQTAHRVERLTELCRRHQSALYRTCLGVVRRPDLAEDAVQQTFLTVLKRGRGQRFDGSEHGWLHRVAVNASLQLLRAERRRRRHETAAADVRFADTRTGDAADVQALGRAVAALPARWRMPVLLRFQQDLSYREIAEALDCPEGTVAYRLHEALGRLREALARSGVVLTGATLEAALSGLPRAAAPGGLLAKVGAGALAAGTAVRWGAALRGWLGAAAIVAVAAVTAVVAFVTAVQPALEADGARNGVARTVAAGTGGAESGDKGSAGGSESGVRVTFRPADGLAESGATAPAERPPYPWTLPPAVSAAVARLEQSVSVNFSDTPLTEVLAKLEELAGVRFETASGIDPAVLSLTMRVEDLPLENVLGLVGRMHDLHFAPRLDGVIGVRTAQDAAAVDPQEAVLQDLQGTLDRLHRAIEIAAGDETLAEQWRVAAERSETMLRELRLDEDLPEADPRDIVRMLANWAQPRILVDQEFLRNEDATLPRLAVAGGGRELRAVLDEVCARTGLQVIQAGGEVHLASPLRAEAIRQEYAERLRAVERTLAQPTAFAAAAVPGHGLAGVLQSQSSVVVVVSQALWEREAAITLPTEPIPLRAALDHLARENGLNWRLIDGVVYLF